MTTIQEEPDPRTQIPVIAGHTGRRSGSMLLPTIPTVSSSRRMP
jgi:hypothetical protein